MSIDNPLLVLVGVPLMALFCWLLSRWIPLLDSESRAHADSLPIDGLRGVLASSVFFHHGYVMFVYRHTGVWAEPASNFYGQLGPTAVTMFFFISGFLFWRKMLQDPASLRPVRLWPNRLRRIMPAYWAAVACAFLTIAVVSGFRLREPAVALLSRAIFWLSVGFPRQLNLNGVVQEPITAGVYWTLRVELLFYLVLPALVWFRRSWRPLLIPALALLVNLALQRWTPQNPFTASVIDNLERFTSAMVTGFSVGGLAAYLTPAAPRLQPVAKILKSPQCAALGGLMLIAHLFWIKGSYSWTEVILLAPVFLMIACGNTYGGILISRPMRCLGQISYSVYIFHGLILFALTSMVNRYAPISAMGIWSYLALIIGISLAVVLVCTFTYRFIERPFFKKRTELAGSSGMPPAIPGNRAGN
jgi:peptidoglycan/LPS O-acetylase OafA/YrhL